MRATEPLCIALVALCVAVVALQTAGCAALDERVADPHPSGMDANERGNTAAMVGLGSFLGAVAMSSENDKLAHGLAGFGASVSCGLVMRPMDGLACGLVGGGAKEGLDVAVGGTADEKDFYSTAAGALLGYGLLKLTEPGFLPWQPRDKALLAANFGCHAWDYRQTEWALEQGGFREGNPLMGDSPSDEKLAAQKAVAMAVVYGWGHFETEHRTAALAALLVPCLAVIGHNYSEGARP